MYDGWWTKLLVATVRGGTRVASTKIRHQGWFGLVTGVL